MCEGWYVFRLACAPNIFKERAGRVLQLCMAVDVRDGEELCINYVDVWEAGARRRQLLSNWYFDCVCEWCEKDSGYIRPRVGALLPLGKK